MQKHYAWLNLDIQLSIVFFKEQITLNDFREVFQLSIICDLTYESNH